MLYYLSNAKRLDIVKISDDTWQIENLCIKCK